MGNTLIKVACTDQTLSVIENPLVAAGGIKEDVVEFQFCSLWDGFTKTAVFYRDKDNVYHVALDLNNKAIVPKEVLMTEGTVYFGVYGVSGDVTRTSEVLRYKIKEGAIIEGTTPADPTPDIYTQILSKVASVESTIGTTALTTTNQTLKGAINEVKNTLDNINIGGRNLLFKTNQGSANWNFAGSGTIASTDYRGDNGMKLSISADTSNGDLSYISVNSLAIQPGTNYILSFDAVANKAFQISPIGISSKQNNTSIVVNSRAISVSDTNTHFTLFFQTIANEFSEGEKKITFWITANGRTAGTELSIANLKLEKGNEATDWTPAPEDFDVKIAALEARIAALEGS